MQIEHLTLIGNTAIRGSEIILPETIALLKKFQIKSGTFAAPMPKTNLGIKITATTEGAVFDITKAGDIGITNVCCFEEKHTNTLLKLVERLQGKMGFGEARLPILSNWIYSIPVNPFALSIEELKIAGEIELYIYYALYLARK